MTMINFVSNTWKIQIGDFGRIPDNPVLIKPDPDIRWGMDTGYLVSERPDNRYMIGYQDLKRPDTA